MSIRREIAEILRPRRGDADGLLTPLFLMLTFATGVVDATSYLRLGHVFVANMTGNVVFLGFGLAGASDISVWAALAALCAFLVGGVFGGRIAAASADDRRRHFRRALAVEAALVAAAVVVAASADRQPGAGARYTLIVLLGLAMGVQTATARKLAVADLPTTVLTQTLAGLASDSPLAGGSGARVGRRGLSVVAMLAGALVGGLLVLRVDNVAPLVVVAAVLAAVLLLLTLDRASTPSSS